MQMSLRLVLLVAVTLPACESLDSIGEATGTDMSALSADGLTGQLRAVADEFLSARGVELPSDVASLLDEFIQGGADRLMQSDFAAASLSDAKANLVTFLEQFLEAAGAGSGEQALQATVETFDQVKAQVCPLEPFCA